MSSNYDLMMEQARQLFLNYDLQKACRRLSLPFSDREIPIRFLGKEFFIQFGDGRVLDAAGQVADFNTVMSVYDVLCRSEITPVLKGEFVPTTALSRIHGTQPIHEDLHAGHAAFFTGKAAELSALCLRLGGTPWGHGDVSFILPVFDFFPVRVCFWDADEEFPASLQFFWDANALDFLHYETLWYIANALIELFREEFSGTAQIS